MATPSRKEIINALLSEWVTKMTAFHIKLGAAVEALSVQLKCLKPVLEALEIQPGEGE